QMRPHGCDWTYKMAINTGVEMARSARYQPIAGKRCWRFFFQKRRQSAAQSPSSPRVMAHIVGFNGIEIRRLSEAGPRIARNKLRTNQNVIGNLTLSCQIRVTRKQHKMAIRLDLLRLVSCASRPLAGRHARGADGTGKRCRNGQMARSDM